MKILVTGGAGFIGSVMVGYLNQQGIKPMVADNITGPEQYRNLVNKKFMLVSNDEALEHVPDLDAIIHLGANSSTTTRDWAELYEKNVKYTRQLCDLAYNKNTPMVFASSASVTGNGNGPLCEYAFSKALSEEDIKYHAICMRLFNVYGPNEYHKTRMSSVVMHWYAQLLMGKEITVFNNSAECRRDFIYVEDVCAALYQAVKAKQENPEIAGIWDLGTGVAESFLDVAKTVIECYGSGSMKMIDMPEDLVLQYQTHTQANVAPLQQLGIDHTKFLTMSDGVSKYCNYLAESRFL